MFQQRLQFFRSLLLLADALIIAACWIAAYYLRFHLPIAPVTKGLPGITPYLWGLLLVEAIWLIAFYFTGLYHLPRQSWTKIFWDLVKAGLIAFLVLIALTYFTHRQAFSRIVFVQFFVLATMSLSVVRWWLKRLFITSRRPGFRTPTLVIGAEELGQMTAQRLASRPELGVEVVGFVASEASAPPPPGSDLPVLGSYQDIDRIITEKQVGLVMLALPLEMQPRLGEILDSIADEMVEVKVVPDLYRFMSLGGSVEQFDGLPIVSIRESPMHGWNRILKQALDITLASVVLAVFSPVMAAAAIAVKLSSPGPVFYRQPRMGLDGRIFYMAKFRTMRQDAEAATGPIWAKPDDPRRTRVGRFLRRFSIDELPQLFHVLKGEMSLVGPRPERPELIKQFKVQIPRYMLRHKMKAGMTGWAQINGFRGNTSLEGRIKHDLEYIQNWSLAFDLKILARTLWHVLADPHAY